MEKSKNRKNKSKIKKLEKIGKKKSKIKNSKKIQKRNQKLKLKKEINQNLKIARNQKMEKSDNRKK